MKLQFVTPLLFASLFAPLSGPGEEASTTAEQRSGDARFVPAQNQSADERASLSRSDGGPLVDPNAPPPRFRGPPRGFGGMAEKKIVAKFDLDGDKHLNVEERKAARQSLATERAEQMAKGESAGGRGPGGRSGGWPGRRENQAPPQPGVKIAPAEVKSYAGVPLYDPGTVRTLFLEFENSDWEKELADFKNTDVEVPATLTVDGKRYPDVGVHFRGMSSFMMVGEGRKRSLNLSLDFVHGNQRLGGYRTLNLLNSNGDPTMLRAVLYNQIAREYIPAPKANSVRVVINGENWGIYVNAQQFNKDFLEEWFATKKGARWKAPGRPNGNSGLEYLGDDVAEYKKRFQIKSKDDAKSWGALIELCRVLNETPADQLETKLAPLLDIDGALKFLALENIFINTDGYWTRASDFSLYQDTNGKFHIIPHDVNETFQAPEGPGRRERAEPGKELELDPFAGADDPKKPLLSKLLAAPELRARYSRIVREIAERWLDWSKIGPLAETLHALIAEDVKIDTRRLGSFEAFVKGLTEDTEEQGFRGPRRSISLKTFVDTRRDYLLNHPAIRSAAATVSAANVPAEGSKPTPAN